MSNLNPPRINTHGVQEASDASDDHFSSASEGGSGAEIPITRVEKVDDEPRHGEIPGTPAYQLRAADSVADEVEIIPEGQRSPSGTSPAAPNRGRGLSTDSRDTRAETPGGTPIPRTVVEKVDFKPSYGEVEGTHAKELHMADASPDFVVRAPAVAGQALEGRDEEGDAGGDDEIDDDRRQAWFRSMWERDEAPRDAGDAPAADKDAEDDDFGEDFDDFAEGGEHEDFGEFDEAPDEEEDEPKQASTFSSTVPDISSALPPLNLSSCTKPSEINEAITPYINAILPDSTPIIDKHDLQPLDLSSASAFADQRSLSLWQQLVSPPPMQPPNWTRSRIRRLFLVSLGVPVDLDEILPPSKQKRLVLPSVGLDGSRPSTALDRLKDQNMNDSTTSVASVDSKTGKPKPSKSSSKQRKGPPPPPDFDVNAASLLCATTQEALSVYSDDELKHHNFTLEILNKKASTVLEYWLQRKDEAVKEKEALEGVIENLVGFVKGRRGAAGR